MQQGWAGSPDAHSLAVCPLPPLQHQPPRACGDTGPACLIHVLRPVSASLIQSHVQSPLCPVRKQSQVPEMWLETSLGALSSAGQAGLKVPGDSLRTRRGCSHGKRGAAREPCPVSWAVGSCLPAMHTGFLPTPDTGPREPMGLAAAHGLQPAQLPCNPAQTSDLQQCVYVCVRVCACVWSCPHSWSPSETSSFRRQRES